MVSADLTWNDIHLVLSDVGVTGTAASYALSGAGSIQTPSIEADLTLSDVAWSTGDCRPSGGSVEFTAGLLSGTIEFSATTPEDGIVVVTIPPADPYEYELPPCGQQ